MGICCSKNPHDAGSYIAELECDECDSEEGEEEDCMEEGDCGAKVMLKGYSSCVSMFTQQGRKGVNQDAMTVWEDFVGDKDMVFCGVFDGHGPSGHRVARFIRDKLPSKLSSAIKSSQGKGSSDEEVDDHDKRTEDSKDSQDEDSTSMVLLSSWEASFIRSFKEMDQELSQNSSMDCFCSGTTAVTVVKLRDHLMVTNLGDSRAVLCTRGQKNQPVPVQLTVDLKPNLPSEAERIRKCRGRVFAVEEEPDVFRVWMPEDNCPGLAMARAFGDFCLKDYGLISTPELSYRKIMPTDEFVVLATDGVWDVLSNIEVVRIVASVRNRSRAAKVLVRRAAQAWGRKYPGCKVDDCAAICLFLKPQTSIASKLVVAPKQGIRDRTVPCISISTKSGEIARMDNAEDEDEDWDALEGVHRVNSLLTVPRSIGESDRRKIEDDFEEIAVH